MGRRRSSLLQEVVCNEEDEEIREQGSGRQAQALLVHVRLRQGLHRQEVTEETREEEASGAIVVSKSLICPIVNHISVHVKVKYSTVLIIIFL